jgi:hypothetical protein
MVTERTRASNTDGRCVGRERRARAPRGVSLCLCAVVASLPPAACTAPARSTRLQARDFEDIAAEVAAALDASDFLRERAPDSEPIVVAVRPAVNLSADLVSEGERWYLVDRVLDGDRMDALRRARNIRFVVPEARLASLARESGWGEALAPERRPTHAFEATLRSVTRAAGADRTDLYAAHYRVTRLDSGQTEWAGEFILKRAAVGRSYY